MTSFLVLLLLKQQVQLIMATIIIIVIVVDDELFVCEFERVHTYITAVYRNNRRHERK